MKTTREWRDKMRLMFAHQKDTIDLLDDAERCAELEALLRDARSRIVVVLGGADRDRQEILNRIDAALGEK